MHSVVCRQDEEMAQQLGVKTIILGEAERGVLCAFLHDEAILWTAVKYRSVRSLFSAGGKAGWWNKIVLPKDIEKL